MFLEPEVSTHFGAFREQQSFPPEPLGNETVTRSIGCTPAAHPATDAARPSALGECLGLAGAVVYRHGNLTWHGIGRLTKKNI